MKKTLLYFSLTLNIFLVTGLLFAFGTQPGNSSGKKFFIAEYTLGATWDTTKNYDEQLYFDHHSRHLSALRKNGTIVLGARYAHKGIVIFNAENLQKAENIIQSDTAVQHKLFSVTVDELYPFYDGCITGR